MSARSRSHSGADGPDVRRPYDAGHNTTPPAAIKRKSRPGHPDLGPDEPERPLFDGVDPRRHRRPTHPDLDRPESAGPLTDALAGAMSRILRRFSRVFHVEIQGTYCPVHLVVATDRWSGPAPPENLTWEIEEPRADGLTQVVSVSAPVGLTPECSCSEFDRDWDCRHIRALQRVGILGNPNHLDDADCPCPDCAAEEGGASC